MEIKAESKYIRISPIKARIPANIVRGMLAVEAVEVLKYTNKKAANDIGKVIKSAIANAKHNNNLSADDLVVKDIQVTEGPRYKRFRPAAKGRYRPFVRRSCHIFVTLESLSNITEKSLSSKPKKETKAPKVEAKKPVEKKLPVKKETKVVKKPTKATTKKKK